MVATPYEDCLIRNAQRERKVPEEVIKRMYYNFYVPQYFEGFNDIQIIHNEILPIKWDELLENGLPKGILAVTGERHPSFNLGKKMDMLI